MPSINRLLIVISLLVLGAVTHPGVGAQGFAMTFGHINAVSNTSISVVCDDGRTLTYPIASGAFVTLDGKPAKVSDLSTGQTARVAIGQGTATAIYAKTSVLSASGKIVAIDSSSISLFVPSGATVKFELSPDTKYTVYGQPATASGLRAGMLASVTLTNSEVTTIAILLPNNAVMNGKISTISATAISVYQTIDTPVQYTITDATIITVNGKPAKAGDLHMGQQVQVTSDDGATARTIAAYLPAVHGEAHHPGAGD
jgi:ribosomal protein S8E